ncbi:MAG: exo-alpha-sialidase [Chromatiales bacterium]|nr:exo-alpha-sialidase [Chromatiales bacterium]
MNESDFRYVDDPSVAADDAIAVAWVDQARKDVMLTVFEADGTPRFSDGPVNVSRSPEAFSWLPRVVFGDDGAVYVLWQEILFTGGSHGGEILFAHSEDGGRTFGDPVNLSRSTAGAGKGRLTAEHWHNGSLDLVRASNGRLYAAWTEYEGGLWVAASTDGGKQFSAPVEVVATGSAAPARGPTLAVTAEGVVLVSWTVGEDPAADIHLARSTDGGQSFSDPQRVHVSPGHADAPALAVDGNGRVHLAWGYRDPDAPRQGRIALAHSDDDGINFSDAQLLDHGDDVPHSAAFPSLAVGDNGVHVVAERIHDAGRGFQGLLHAWAADGETFTELRTLPGTDAAPSGGRQGLLMRKLALHPDGRILAVHSTFDQGRRSGVYLLASRRKNDT